jgi:uncharacterized protein
MRSPSALILLVPLAACASAAALHPSPARAQPPVEAGQQLPASFLEVSGSAEVQVSPDRATVAFAVEVEAPTAAEAGQANATQMTAMVAAVRGTGLPGLRVETFGYALDPVYRYDEPDRRPRIDGYRVRNHVRAIVPDPQEVGRVIDAAISAGASRVASLTFDASDTDSARQEALRLAVQRAKGEAEAIAGAMGVQLGAPLEVRGGAAAPPPFFPAARDGLMIMEAAVATPIEVGTQSVSASVTIRYHLLPR